MCFITKRKSELWRCKAQNPALSDLYAVAAQIGIRETQAKKIALEIQECVLDMLGVYL